MKRIFLAAMVTFITANTAAFAEEQRGQTDSMPISKPSDWNNMMPKEVPMNLPSHNVLSAPSSSSQVNTFSAPHSEPNPFQSPMPTIGVPADSMAKPPQENVMQRVSRNAHEAMEFAQKGDFNHALEAVDKAIALDPKVDFLYNLRSHLYGKMGKQQEAARDMARYQEMQKQRNEAALDKWHQQQEQEVGLPPLRERIKKFLGN